MLNLKNICVEFPTSSDTSKKVLNNLNVAVHKGEFVLIVGDNGSGKSTLFNTISGTIIPTKGTITLNNKDITTMCVSDRAAMIAHVLQDPRHGTLPQLTIFENMVFASKRGKSRSLLPYVNRYDKNYFKDHLALLGRGLENRLDDSVEKLSGGQRQALSVAMALLNEPQLLLLDEITAALDQETGITLMNMVQKIVKEKNYTVLMITHNMQHVQRYGDRVMVLKNGVLTEIDRKNLAIY